MSPEDVNTEPIDFEVLDEWLEDLTDIGIQFCLWSLIPKYIKMLENEITEPETSGEYILKEQYKKIISTLRIVQESLGYDIF